MKHGVSGQRDQDRSRLSLSYLARHVLCSPIFPLYVQPRDVRNMVTLPWEYVCIYTSHVSLCAYVCVSECVCMHARERLYRPIVWLNIHGENYGVLGQIAQVRSNLVFLI